MGMWLPAENPSHRILSCRDPSGWIMPEGRPHASWLRQVESYLRDTGMTVGVCLGDGQTEAEGVPSQGGRSSFPNANTAYSIRLGHMVDEV